VGIAHRHGPRPAPVGGPFRPPRDGGSPPPPTRASAGAGGRSPPYASARGPGSSYTLSGSSSRIPRAVGCSGGFARSRAIVRSRASAMGIASANPVPPGSAPSSCRDFGWSRAARGSGRRGPSRPGPPADGVTAPTHPVGFGQGRLLGDIIDPARGDWRTIAVPTTGWPDRPASFEIEADSPVVIVAVLE